MNQPRAASAPGLFPPERCPGPRIEAPHQQRDPRSDAIHSAAQAPGLRRAPRRRAQRSAQILGEGILCGFIPTGWYDSCSQNPRIRVLPLRGFSNEAEIGLYWKKDEPLSPAAQLFLQFLREEEKKTENSL